MNSLSKAVAVLFCLSTTFGVSAENNKLSDTEKQIVKAVENNFQSQINFLEKIVNINSGTRHLKGVRDVGKAFEQEFSKIGFKNTWIEMPKEMDRAGHLLSEKSFGKPGKKIMLIGHLDTVFPK
ncbi:MAG: M20 family peptidase, partial [Gammaproteobacteria bacterium]|nr:M20 family peptidase [Gammaproteobacteria bacterium]